MKTIMRNDFKMIVFKQLTISIDTKWQQKKVSCSANKPNVTLHVKHDHQYRRNFKSLNIIWCIVCFFKKYVLRSSCWMQSALRMFTFYTIFKSCTATIRPPVKLRNYQSVAWVLYQRVIDQSKDDIFIKPGII
jgi:hypothetical protein